MLMRSWRCGCFATGFCYQIAKPGNKTAASPWPDPYSVVFFLCSVERIPRGQQGRVSWDHWLLICRGQLCIITRTTSAIRWHGSWRDPSHVWRHGRLLFVARWLLWQHVLLPRRLHPEGWRHWVHGYWPGAKWSRRRLLLDCGSGTRAGYGTMTIFRAPTS